jgi:hypothetical protein
MYSFEEFRKLFETICGPPLDQEFIEEFFKSEDDFQRNINLHRYKNPHNSHLFNKKVLVDFDFLIEMVENELPELNISKSDIEQYLQNGYFPELYFEDGKKGFMLFTTMRIKFINEIIRKWNYNTEEIRKITEFEDMLIDEVLTTQELEYSELPTLPFLIKYLKDSIRENRLLLKTSTELEKEYKILIEKDREVLELLEGKEWEDLSLDLQKSINDTVFKIHDYLEFLRISFHLQYEANILLGFSQQHSISSTGWDFSNSKENEKIFNKITNKEYPYKIYYIDRTWLYGEWKYSPDWIKPEDVFFATPEFYIGYGKENQIDISIRKPENVDAKYMRDITRYYTKFRKHLNIPKTKWGEKSGRKESQKHRNRILREEYSKLRAQYPLKSAESQINKVLDQLRKEFKGISTETAKRIIYKKETRQK